MRVWVSGLVGLTAATLMAGSSHASGPPAACSSDVKKLCGATKPGGGRLTKCLARHQDKLSKSCAEALASPTSGGVADKSGKPARTEETYTTVEFVLRTGGDDLRGDSMAWALIEPPKHKAVTCMLHEGAGDSFANGSITVIPCDLPAKLTMAQLRNRILIGYYGQPQGGFETQDNWSLNGVTVRAYSKGTRPVCVFGADGNPLYRFQGIYAGIQGGKPGFWAYGPGTTPADDGMVVTDFPTNC